MIALFFAALFTFFGIKRAMPWLHETVLAKVTERSSHEGLVPQGGGLIIFIVALLVTLVYPPLWGTPLFLLLLAILLSLLGFVDDHLELSPLLRFTLQGGFVAGALYLVGLPPHLPLIVAFFGLLWYVNLSNFMDGIDWMSVLHISFMCFGLWLLTDNALWLLLLGGIAGFAPYNFPKAKLFMGDAGSLPFGLLIGAGLIIASQQHGLLPPFILSLYYISDATITLVLRLWRREKVWLPHRSHFYQQATKHLTIKQILTRLALTHSALLGLALLAKRQELLALTLAFCVVGILLWNFKTKQL